MNTKIEYLYRDSDNYKTLNTCVISGIITEKQIDRIINCLDEGIYFIPDDVGLSEDRNYEYDPETDHVWFELEKGSFSQTEELPTENMTVDMLIEAFERANWDEVSAMERLESY